MLDRMISEDTPSAISLPVSASGATPCAAPVGQTTAPCGLAPARANLSARQAKARGLMTSGTYGPHSTTLSASAALTRFLASRLQAKTASVGSILYRLTWKDRVTPSGRSIPALRASARLISDNGFTGWPTPKSTDAKGNPYEATEARRSELRKATILAGWPTPTTNTNDQPDNTQRGLETLLGQAKLAGWVSPTAQDHSRGAKEARSHDTGVPLTQQVALAGWPTPTTRDHKDTGDLSASMQRRDGKMRRDSITRLANLCYPARLTASGEMLIGSSAVMESGGQLNPAHPRWLMGLPPEWDACAVMAMQSLPRKRKHSSKP